MKSHLKILLLLLSLLITVSVYSQYAIINIYIPKTLNLSSHEYSIYINGDKKAIFRTGQQFTCKFYSKSLAITIVNDLNNQKEIKLIIPPYQTYYFKIQNEFLGFKIIQMDLNQGKSEFEDKTLFTKGIVEYTETNKNKEIFQNDVKIYVENKINEWQKKGKFEKLADYQNRVNETTRQEKINSFTQDAINYLAYQSTNLNKSENEYDADNECFKITFLNLPSIFLKVPINEAPKFDENFKNVTYSNPQFTYTDYGFALLHLEFEMPGISKKYVYDSKNVNAFNSNQLNLNFEPIEIDINNTTQLNLNEQNNQTTKVITIGKSDIDLNVPENSFSDLTKNTYCLIIGNEDYTKYQPDLNSEANVLFAENDARTFAIYAEKTLSIPKDNIKVLINGISTVMKREIERIVRLAELSKGEIIFFYAGHGFPDEKTHESYIMPVDISGVNVKDGIKLSSLYEQFSNIDIRKVVVFIDACFSGGGRNQGLLTARGVKVVPKANHITGNVLVFSACSGDQVSLPYKDKQHGMFTYFLLKKMQESKGNISCKELADYVSDEVKLNSIKINYKDQSPEINIGVNIVDKWSDWKIY